MPATTSAARRNPIWIFGAATGGRPIRFHALNCSGKTSLNGFARAKSSAVHSGFLSNTAGGLGLLVMVFRPVELPHLHDTQSLVPVLCRAVTTIAGIFAADSLLIQLRASDATTYGCRLSHRLQLIRAIRQV